MKLPVVSATTAPSSLTFWRRYIDLLFDHSVAFGEEIVLPGARGVIGKDSTQIGHVIVSAGESPVDVDAISRHFAGVGRPVWTTPSNTPPVEAALNQSGYQRQPRALLRLRAARSQFVEYDDVMLLPARAARAVYTAWCERRSSFNRASSVLPVHLDDPQYDAIVALRHGVAIAAVGLQVRGQAGLICDWFVDPNDRRRRIGSTLLSRAIELAARSQLQDLFVAHGRDVPGVSSLFRSFGFDHVCDFDVWSA